MATIQKIQEAGTKNKTPVVGALQRGGKVFAKMQSVLKFADLKKTAKELIDFDNAALITDDCRGYIPFKNLINTKQLITLTKNMQEVNHIQTLLRAFDRFSKEAL